MATGPKYYTEEYNKLKAFIDAEGMKRFPKAQQGAWGGMVEGRAEAGKTLLPAQWFDEGNKDLYAYYDQLEKVAASYNTSNLPLDMIYNPPGASYNPRIGPAPPPMEHEKYFAALKYLASLEADPGYENFYSGRALGQARREGQVGTTGKLFRPNTQFAPGYEGRKSKLGADIFQSGPGKGLNKPGPENQPGSNLGDRAIHSHNIGPRSEVTPPTTALGGQPVYGTQVTGGIYGGASAPSSLPASDQPLASAAPARRPTRLGRV